MGSQLQDKMNHYEVAPPARVWEGIDAALDAGAGAPFAEKLHEFESAPPASTWNKIEMALQQPGKKAPVIFFTRYRKALRYSSAAAILLFMAFLSALLINRKAYSELNSTTLLDNPPAARENNIPSTSNTTKDSSTIVKNIPVATASIAKTSTQKQPRVKSGSSYASLALGSALLPRQATRNSAIQYSPQPDKYMVYSDGDGNAVRLSKKLFDLYSCAESDRNCRQRIILMQEKLAAYALSSDFAGILEILSNLKENP